ncbi:Spo0E like sporulation regulatory protein [Clostridium homopropionicum DSM 5847]|uniref:Spo0E like sporulation regulatory protein n=1 Tax=Clostridium homopropionicum DSM 5847 TaxID=1121318 RepID=A0A0L6ZCF7_9CLOT|nr:aspartyl-phosphate phosphatase Spo0E family protein [Clostridium homopropionicum]KOA20664.1 Spo0E like sporulation regulatory protein [Clostridium homopropionicum DSM 5847]SFF91974.1 Spo0E like sporulation regulatory protein [Clostridium homopropionicum]
MLEKRIDELREKLNKECEYHSLISNKIIVLSQTLDECIVEYYREMLKNKDSINSKIVNR